MRPRQHMVPRIESFRGKYRFLSNFYPAEIEINGHTYPTSEHAFQAAKTTRSSEHLEILRAKTPGDAKRLGRTCTMREDWDAVKIDVMRSILRIKFKIPLLREMLLDTGSAELVEGNTWGDRFWGQDPIGTGQNWLGRLLMEIRSEIRKG